jgi:hypothetical protein
MSIRSVCVFCGARDGVGMKYAQATRAFARTLPANRIERSPASDLAPHFSDRCFSHNARNYGFTADDEDIDFGLDDGVEVARHRRTVNMLPQCETDNARTDAKHQLKL